VSHAGFSHQQILHWGFQNMRSDSTHIPGLSPEARAALINAAMEKLILAAKELHVSICDLQCMLELGMTPVDVVDYLEARLRNRIQ